MEVPISVEEAICRVLAQAKPLSTVQKSLSNVEDLLGSTIAKYYFLYDVFNALMRFSNCRSVIADDNFPAFPASIMDGYAVQAPLAPGNK